MIMNTLSTILAGLFTIDEYTLSFMITRWAGRLNLLLMLVALSPFFFRRINKYFYHHKNPAIRKLLKPLSKRHPIVGITLLFSAFIHGHFALGSVFRWHTGPLAFWILFLMMLLVLFGGKYKLKGWLTIHKSLAIGFILSAGLHLLARNIL